MKHNSKQFLALFMAVSMAVAPVSGVYAEDQNAAVENAVNAGQVESSVTEAESQEENKTEAAEKEAAEKETAEKETTGSTQNILTGQKDENVQQGQQQVQNKKAGVQVQSGTGTAAD